MHTHSPFISTTNDFFWVLRLAAKIVKAGVGRNSAYISIISVPVLEPTSIYHALPLHRESHRRGLLGDCTLLERGVNEFLVHARIPSNAVLHTFAVDSLFDLTNHSPGLADLLRINAARRDNLRELCTVAKIRLDSETLNAIAKLVKVTGINAASDIDAVSQMVADIARGFCVQLECWPPDDWREAAARFQHALTRHSHNGRFPSLRQCQRLQLAFLEGIRASLGDANAKASREGIQAMARKAASIGLSSPAAIVIEELEGARLQIARYQNWQERLVTPVNQPLPELEMQEWQWRPVAGSGRDMARLLTYEKAGSSAVMDDVDSDSEEEIRFENGSV